MPFGSRKIAFLLPLIAIPLMAIPLTALRVNDEPAREFAASLRGPGEVPLSLTAAHGTLKLSVSSDNTVVHFVLTYEGLETHIRFSHIHVGKPTDSGGVTVFFCGGGPAGHVRPACPDGSGTVEGDFTADDVIGLVSQELAANDLARLLRAIRSGQTYANLHTDASPGGEIRGQIHAAEGDR